MIEKTIEEQLQDLREKWLKANPMGRKIIECKVQLPPFNLKLKQKNLSDTIEIAEEVFGVK